MKNKEQKTILDENGNPILFAHGTNRQFDKHSLEKNRTVLNDQHQGDWICYSARTPVAWKYTDAPRNQCLDKYTFIEEITTVFDKLDKEMSKHLKDLSISIMKNGYSKGWDIFLDKYETDRDLEHDVGRYEKFFPMYQKFEKKHNIDLNDFFDVLDFVEYSRASENPDSCQNLFDMLNGSFSVLQDETTDFIKELGFKKCIPEPKIILSHLTASKTLKTKSKEKAKNAREKGYDFVIYSGEGTVDGEPEYLVANTEQVLKQATIFRVEVKENKIDEYGDEEEISTYKFIRKEHNETIKKEKRKNRKPSF